MAIRETLVTLTSSTYGAGEVGGTGSLGGEVGCCCTWVGCGAGVLVGGMGVLVGSGGAGTVAATAISLHSPSISNSTTPAEIQPTSSSNSTMYQESVLVLAMIAKTSSAKATPIIA